MTTRRSLILVLILCLSSTASADLIDPYNSWGKTAERTARKEVEIREQRGFDEDCGRAECVCVGEGSTQRAMKEYDRRIYL